jgi:sugar phosphate isomerase/epimerase
MSKFPIAVQLYTVRDLAAKDMPGTLKQIAKIGYPFVELAGYGSLKTASEMKKALGDAGLRACAGHTGIDALEKDLNKVSDEAEITGHQNIVLSFIAESRRKDESGYKQVADLLNRVGAESQRRGIQLSYHNHAFEFQKFNGKTGLELLAELSDAKLVKFELDVCWVEVGGTDPVKLIEKMGKRVWLLHLKDREPGKEVKFTPVGGGVLDFVPILAAGQKAGVQFGIVEQDSTYETPPMEAIRASFEHLQKLGAA